MYARLSRFTFRVEDQARWAETLTRLLSLPAQERDADVLAVLAELDGCRGVWYLVEPDDPSDEELLTMSEASTSFFSLWDTREQAESVRERAGERLAQFFGGRGIIMESPPETQIYRVEGGRAL